MSDSEHMTPHQVFEWAGEQLDAVQWRDSGLRAVVWDVLKRSLARMELAVSQTAQTAVAPDDERAAFEKALFDYGMTFSESLEPGEIKKARERVVSMFASRITRMPSEEEVIAAAETSWSTVSFDENGHSIYHFEKDYLQRFAKNLFAAVQPASGEPTCSR